MPKARKLKLMVASTVYSFQDQLNQICGVLSGFGYEVWNSHLGTIPLDPAKSNLGNCVSAVAECDLFLGIIRPFYGSGIVGPRSITHEECLEAMRLVKPRWFLAHQHVTFARQLLRPYLYNDDGTPSTFQLKKTAVMDDVRVLDLYNDATQQAVPLDQRKGHWVQDFYDMDDILLYLNSQFKNVSRVRKVCNEMKKP
jgi:hypothetical protein